MKRALVVGINDYENSPLEGCIKDADRVCALLGRNEDGSLNFECKKLISSEKEISRSVLKEHIEQLFLVEADVTLLYFSGHGTSNNLGGYVVTQDAKKFDEGVAMNDILKYANDSKAKECVIILDCCYSGAFGNLPQINNTATIREGVTILTACRSTQFSLETEKGGFFTSLVCDALHGSAAGLLGEVTAAGIYAHVEPIFGAWDQRPLFKTHISRSTILRKCKPKIEPKILRELPNFFSSPLQRLALDKSFEPTEEPKGHANEEVFAKLQKCRAEGLVKPDGEDHLYYAAMNGKSCSLTPFGQFYWHLAKAEKI